MPSEETSGRRCTWQGLRRSSRQEERGSAPLDRDSRGPVLWPVALGGAGPVVRSPEGPDLVWIGVVCLALAATFLMAGSCWVPHAIAARSVSGCRVEPVVQLRQERTLAGWDHTGVALIPLVLTGHEGCPSRACQLGTVSPAVVAPCGHVEPMARCCGCSLCGCAAAAAPSVGESVHSIASVHAVCVRAALRAKDPRRHRLRHPASSRRHHRAVVTCGV